jgi:hypothetical protein
MTASHQQRVIDEGLALSAKTEALHAFTGGPIYATLPEAEQGRLTRQLTYMALYLQVLTERIGAFE